MEYYGRHGDNNVKGCVTIAKCCDEKSYLEIATKTQGQSLPTNTVFILLQIDCFHPKVKLLIFISLI